MRVALRAVVFVVSSTVLLPVGARAQANAELKQTAGARPPERSDGKTPLVASGLRTAPN